MNIKEATMKFTKVILKPAWNCAITLIVPKLIEATVKILVWVGGKIVKLASFWSRKIKSFWSRESMQPT
jgi:hypothetical protein